jgi:hypothetical protein
MILVQSGSQRNHQNSTKAIPDDDDDDDDYDGKLLEHEEEGLSCYLV